MHYSMTEYRGHGVQPYALLNLTLGDLHFSLSRLRQETPQCATVNLEVVAKRQFWSLSRIKSRSCTDLDQSLQ